MNMITSILVTILIFFCLFLVISEFASHMVYGKYLKDEEVISFLDKNLKEYRVNSVSWESGKKMLVNHTNFDLPYIAEHRNSFFAAWNIEGYGMVSRWSKSSKVISDYFDALDKPVGKVKLSEL